MALDTKYTAQVQQQVQDSILGATETGSKVVSAEIQELNETVQANKAVDNVANTMTTDDIVNTNVTLDDDGSGGTSASKNEIVDVDPNSYAYKKMLAERYTQDYDDLMSNQGLLPAKEQFIQKDQPIRVGQYTGKIIGSVPIFAAPMPLFPANIMKQRKNELAAAAAARRKIANQVGKALQINVPEQFQKEMDDQRGTLVQKYADATGNRFDILMDFNNPLSQQFWSEADALKQVQATVTDGDKLSEEVLKDFGKKGGKYYPDAITQTALDVRGGALNVKELMKPAGIKTWRENMRKLQGYNNMISVLDPVVQKIGKTIVPMIKGKDLKPEDLNTFEDAYAMSKAGDKKALFQAIKKFIPEARIEEAVRVVMENSNVYLGTDDTEKDKVMSDAEDYVAAMLGDELSTSIQIFDPKRARGTSVSIHNPKKEKDTPYGDMVNEFNDHWEGVYTTFSPDVAAGVDATTFKFNPVGKAAYKTARNAFSQMYKMPIVTDGTGKMKLKINMGGGIEKFNIDAAKIEIGAGMFNGKTPYETIFEISKKNSFSTADKGAFKLITGKELESKTQAEAAILNPSQKTLNVDGGLVNRVNDSPTKVIRQELVLTHNGTDIDETYIGKVYAAASNSKTGTAEEKAIAGQNAVTEMYRTVEPKARLYMQPLRDEITYTNDQKAAILAAEKAKVDITKLRKGDAAEKAKFKDAIQANIYMDLMGTSDDSPNVTGKRKEQIDETYNGVGWTQDYSFSEDYGIIGLDELIGSTGVAMYTKHQLDATGKNTSTNTSNKKIVIQKK